MKSSLFITYTIRDLHVVTSSRKYTQYRKINRSYDFLCNGKEIVTIEYDQTYVKIGRTIVYTTGSWSKHFLYTQTSKTKTCQ